MNSILCGDALTMLKTLPDRLVQMCCTSPPYYALRDYGVSGQIGLEETPQQYIATLVEVFREVWRVLRDDGTLWANLGDSYAAGKAGRTDYGTGDPTSTLGPMHNGLPHNTRPGTVIERKAPAGFKPKDLMMMPARVAIALQADGWCLRSDIIWHKPNCMPESVTDRPTSAHEHIFLMAKSERYYYDNESTKERAIYGENRATYRGGGTYIRNNAFRNSQHTQGDGEIRERPKSETRNKRDVWTVASYPYPESHFATFPPKLIEPCILAGSRPGDIVLDPFMGAGTTALVALQYKRRYLGIELNPAYVALAEKRIAHVQQGLWIEVSEVGA